MMCHGCGGVVGRDCFNPQECEQITRAMADQGQQDAQDLYHAQAQIAHLQSQNERLLSALKDTTERMKRVRSILTGLSKEPDSWQMLNAEKYDELINSLEKQPS